MADPESYRPARQDIPTAPGVYRFRDEYGRVVYVGKAKNLRNRLSSYFAPPHALSPKTRAMVTTAAGVEWTVVGSELESLQLEYTWIKEFAPRFNIVFRDDKWPHSDSSNTLALTTVTFNPQTGEIYDADMEVNTYDQRVTLVDPVPPDGYDFASIMTHETGHFLGLAHSGDNRATMYANYTPGATAMRNLTADDVAGICEIYRPDGTRAVLDSKVTPGPQCDPTPRRGFTGECEEPPKKGCIGGSIAPRSPTRPSFLAVVFAGIGALAMRRRVTRKR